MTGRKKSSLSSVGVLACLFAFYSCSSPTENPAQNPNDLALNESLSEPINRNVEHAVLVSDEVLTLSATETKDASIVVAQIKIPGIVSDLRGAFLGREIPFYAVKEYVYEAIIAVPYLQDPGTHEFSVRWKEGHDEKRVVKTITTTLNEYGSEVLSVNPSKVTPPKSAMARIQREKREVGQIYRTVEKTKYWSGKFDLPMKSTFTSVFGTKRIFNGQFKNFHNGLDLKARVGEKIFAPEAGRVVMAKDLYFTGKTVIIDHGFGVMTLYAHLSRLSVKKNQVVQKAQLLGYSGATGRVSGPHLHWAAIIHGDKVNPIHLTTVIP